MSKEIEVKFLNINIKDIRKKIKAIGGTRVHPLMVYKRYVFLLHDSNMKGYVRVRQENKTVTMTIKTYDPKSKYANETEIKVKSSLKEARDFLSAAGFVQKAYHETIREKWKVEGCSEVVIDCIPGIPTYIEIECPSEANVKKVAKQLDLDFKDAVYGAYGKQFVDLYGLTRDEIDNDVSSLTFANIDKELKSFIKKNQSELKKVKSDHLELLKTIKK